MYHCCGFGFRQPWCHKWKKKQSTKTHPVQRHVLIVSCSYALILAPASATFTIINPAPAGFAKTKSGTVLIMTMRDINLLFTPSLWSVSTPTFSFVAGFSEDLSEKSPRWMNWIRDVDHITKFLQTGEICHGCELSEARHNMLMQMAQRYYIESE